MGEVKEFSSEHAKSGLCTYGTSILELYIFLKFKLKLSKWMFKFQFNQGWKKLHLLWDCLVYYKYIHIYNPWCWVTALTFTICADCAKTGFYDGVVIFWRTCFESFIRLCNNKLYHNRIYWTFIAAYTAGQYLLINLCVWGAELD